MSVVSIFGDRVRTARERKRRDDGKRWEQKDLAAAVGVAPNTVSGWETRGAKPRDPALLGRLASVLGVRVEWLLGTTDDETGPSVAAPVERTWPQQAREFVADFVAEATRKGATDEDVEYVRRVLTSPESYVMYKGGQPQEMTDTDMLIEMGFLGTGLRVWLQERMKRRRER